MPRLPGQQHQGLFQPQQQQWAQLQRQPEPVQPIFTASNHQRTHSNNSQNSPPLITSGNGSPTSPRAYYSRQIRPLYMPAVLRPTEHPSKAPPPRSSPPAEEEDEDRGLKSNGSFISLGSALTRLSRRSTGDSGKCVEGNWNNLDMFPQPTGLPTRKHWKPDYESTVCDHSTCRKTFSYFTRRHHCRHCGNIFCDDHSAYEIPLDENANYNPRGTPVRGCAHCYSQFKEWRVRANSQDSSIISDSDAGSRERMDVRSSPLSTSPSACAAATKPSAQELAKSVPTDWNWSTF
jgi:hypothetical protein